MSLDILFQLIGALLNMGAFALLHFEIAPSSALRYLQRMDSAFSGEAVQRPRIDI